MWMHISLCAAIDLCLKDEHHISSVIVYPHLTTLHSWNDQKSKAIRRNLCSYKSKVRNFYVLQKKSF